MFTLNDRKRSIVKYLAQRTSPVTVEQLATHFGVSSRTIRYDLDGVAAWAYSQGGHLEVRPRVGVSLQLPASSPDLGQSTYLYPVAAEQRRLLLAAVLLAGLPASSSGAAERLSVSLSTIRNDLSALAPILTGRGLALSHRGDGSLTLAGDESARREALAEVISVLHWDDAVTSSLAALTGSRCGLPEGDLYRRVDPWLALQLCHLTGPQALTAVLEGVVDLEHRSALTFTDEGLSCLLIRAAIAVSRLLRGEPLPATGGPEPALPTRSMAHDLAACLERASGAAFPSQEVSALAVHLLGAKQYVRFECLPEVPAEQAREERVSLLCSAMIGLVENMLDCALSDRLLLAGLVAHVRPMLDRLRHGIRLPNPHLRAVQGTYPEVYKASLTASHMLAREVGCSRLPEDEVGFLTFHFAASVERQQNRPVGPRVLVICGSGIGTVRLLLSRLESQFPELNVVGVGAVVDLNEHLASLRPDLVVSTVQVAAGAVPVLVVNPLLGQEDGRRLRVWIDGRAAHQSPRRKPSPPVGASESPLAAIMDAQCVQVDLNPPTWEAAVHAAVAPLVRDGAVTPEYAGAIVEAIRVRGPYQVVAPGLALLHAAPGQFVTQTRIGLTLLKDGVAFHAKGKDPVWALFVLATTDADAHLGALGELSSLLVRDDLLARLRLARTASEALACLR